MNEVVCTYCAADSALVREHVIPAVYLGFRSYDGERQWIVTACETCNKLAGPSVHFSIPDKAAYLVRRYKTYFKKVLSVPAWSEEELEEMEYKFRVLIEESLVARNVVLRRIQQLEVLSRFPEHYMRPEWVEKLMHEWEEVRKPKKRKKVSKEVGNRSIDLRGLRQTPELPTPLQSEGS